MTNRVSLSTSLGMAATIFIAALIAFITLTHVPDPGFQATDKQYHLIAFAALTLPLSFASPRLAATIAVLAFAYGGLIELVQPLVDREGEWRDLLADAAGAGVGAVTGALLRLIWEKYLSLQRGG